MKIKKALFILFLFIFSSLSAQTVSNVTLVYECPCKVTATYDLDVDAGVLLYCSADTTVSCGWCDPVATFEQKAGTNIIDVWDCEAAGLAYGQFFFKLEALLGCVEINGVCWALRNVDMPGTFAATPQDAGMFYQWNRNVGWSNTDPMINSNGGNTWDSSYPPGSTWEPANDPSPAGYRVPTLDEIQSLLNTTYVDEIVTIENGVTGRRFTDNGADGRGNNGNSIFLPAAYFRDNTGELETNSMEGAYWSGTGNSTNTFVAHHLYFYSGTSAKDQNVKSVGYSIRPVAESE